jgi:Raf kinase inhibitor-like YbhB/YbcL family protein
MDTAFSADGDNASPPLSAPEGTQSFVIIVDDPDAAQPRLFMHWLAYDIPASVTSLREGMPTEISVPDPEGMKQGTNSMEWTGYTGPKPPAEDLAFRPSRHPCSNLRSPTDPERSAFTFC